MTSLVDDRKIPVPTETIGMGAKIGVDLEKRGAYRALEASAEQSELVVGEAEVDHRHHPIQSDRRSRFRSVRVGRWSGSAHDGHQEVQREIRGSG